METILYHTPGSCSRVTLNALEEVGLPFEDRPVDIFKGMQATPEYLAVNPKGKVPALYIDGRILTETPAILWYLAQTHSSAALLPLAEDGMPAIEGLVDLSWFSNTLHVLARSARVPGRMTTGDPNLVREQTLKVLAPILRDLDQRVAGNRWWYGETWSILDIYLAWIFDMAVGGGVSPTDHPALSAHDKRVRGRPSFERALKREEVALEQAGIVLPGGGKL
jgi:glutathione S-transferase